MQRSTSMPRPASWRSWRRNSSRTASGSPERSGRSRTARAARPAPTTTGPPTRRICGCAAPFCGRSSTTCAAAVMTALTSLTSSRARAKTPGPTSHGCWMGSIARPSWWTPPTSAPGRNGCGCSPMTSPAGGSEGSGRRGGVAFWSMDVMAPTSLGPGRLVLQPADAAVAALWLGHGAGGGIEARDLAALAARLPDRGITVIRHEQPWRVAGRRGGSPAGRARYGMAGHRCPGAGVDGHASARRRRTKRRGASGVPNRRGHRRGSPSSASPFRCTRRVTRRNPAGPSCSSPRCRCWSCEGERDTFGTAAELAAEVAGNGRIRVVPVPGGDHG